MAKKFEVFDDSDGVWRTVGGRRIFIRTGQSLSSAMKSSGKFKSTRQTKKGEVSKEQNLKEGKTGYDKLDAEYEDTFKELVGYNTKRQELYEAAGSDEAYKNLYGKLPEKNAKNTLSAEDYKKYEELSNKYHEGRKKLAEIDDKIEAYKKENPKEYQEAKNRIDEKRKAERAKEGPSGWEILEKQQEISRKTGKVVSVKEAEKALSKTNSIRSQQSDIEKASGLKVQKAFSTDAFGTGKEDRFSLEDGRWISHSTETLGSKDDTWSINKVENGSIESKDFKSYDDMIKHLSREEQGYGSSYKKYFDKNPNATFEDFEKDYGKRLGGSNKESDEVNGIKLLKARDSEKGTYIEDLVNQYNKYAKEGKSKPETFQSLKKEIAERRKSNVSDNAAYKKAFEEYKKKHPNSKLNFNQFVDMSEGK